jgi:hypothetical protein
MNKIRTRHVIKYDVDDPVSLLDTASALIAMNKLLQRMPMSLAALGPEFRGIRLVPFVEAIEPGSDVFKLIIDLIYGDEKERSSQFAKIRAKLGLTDMQQNSPVVSALIQTAILTSILAVMTQCGRDSQPITLIQNSVIVTGADKGGISEKDLRRAVRKTSKPTRSMAQAGIDVLQPARTNKGAGSITVDGQVATIIPAALVNSVPDSLPPKSPRERTKSFSQVKMDVRALDVDNPNKGWAVIVLQVSTRRLRMELAPSIDPMKLRGLSEITGDIDVTYKIASNGEESPIGIYLRSYFYDSAP